MRLLHRVYTDQRNKFPFRANLSDSPWTLPEQSHWHCRTNHVPQPHCLPRSSPQQLAADCIAYSRSLPIPHPNWSDRLDETGSYACTGTHSRRGHRPECTMRRAAECRQWIVSTSRISSVLPGGKHTSECYLIGQEEQNWKKKLN